MANVIIGIHGLGNKPSKEVLEKWWQLAMLEGLEKHEKSINLPTFELVYWADILYDNPLDEKLTDIEDPNFLDEKYAPSIGFPEEIDLSFRQKVLDFVEDQLDSLFLNDDYSINYSSISDAIIHRYFKDLEAYYIEECLDENKILCAARTLIRERLVQVLEKYRGDKIMLIGHSMGSIVAYDVLTFLMQDLDIHTFITMGSPLGFPVVQGKIAAEWNKKRLVPPKLKTPPGVNRNWYNFADLKDKVAVIYQLRSNFQPNFRGVKVRDFLIQNDYQMSGEPNPHKSYGYLRSREFADVLAKFSQQKHGFFMRLRRKIKI